MHQLCQKKHHWGSIHQDQNEWESFPWPIPPQRNTLLLPGLQRTWPRWPPQRIAPPLFYQNTFHLYCKISSSLFWRLLLQVMLLVFTRKSSPMIFVPPPPMFHHLLSLISSQCYSMASKWARTPLLYPKRWRPMLRKSNVILCSCCLCVRDQPPRVRDKKRPSPLEWWQSLMWRAMVRTLLS